MMKYRFGYYYETVDGKKFQTVSRKECDSDAQAELEAKHVLEHMRPYDMDMNPINSLVIRRDDTEWSVTSHS